jgi:hypothetical protein
MQPDTTEVEIRVAVVGAIKVRGQSTALRSGERFAAKAPTEITDQPKLTAKRLQIFDHDVRNIRRSHHALRSADKDHLRLGDAILETDLKGKHWWIKSQ